MSYRIDRPNYSVMMVDLSSAGMMTINQAAQRLVVTRADKDGAIAPSATIEIALGAQTEDYIPLSHGGHIIAATERYYLRWEAQPGVRMYLTISQYGSTEGGLIVQAPPTASMTVQSGDAWTVSSPDLVAALAGMEDRSLYRRGTSRWSGQVGNAPVEVVAPAANTNGLVIRSSSQGYAAIYAEASPPVVGAGIGHVILGGIYAAEATSWLGRLYVPAGRGIYVSASAITTQAAVCLSWDML